MLAPLVLAFLGDAVFELLVRGRIVNCNNISVNDMHKLTVKYVCCNAQSSSLEVIIDSLSDDEYSMYKRGRNANGNNIPKRADMNSYRRATGIETLFGYLYLSKNYSRINQLFEIIWNELKV